MSVAIRFDFGSFDLLMGRVTCHVGWYLTFLYVSSVEHVCDLEGNGEWRLLKTQCGGAHVDKV